MTPLNSELEKARAREPLIAMGGGVNGKKDPSRTWVTFPRGVTGSVEKRMSWRKAWEAMMLGFTRLRPHGA